MSCFRVKRGECQTVFKTDPTNKPILHLTLGGQVGKKDKIFSSEGPTIRGTSKKGKSFFSFNTNSVEPQHTIFVEDVSIWAASRSSFNIFDDGRVVDEFLSPDNINAMEVCRIGGVAADDKGGKYSTVLGSQGRFVRVIRGSKLVFDASIKGPVTALVKYDPSSSNNNDKGKGRGKGKEGDAPEISQLIYGTENGLLGQLLVDSSTG